MNEQTSAEQRDLDVGDGLRLHASLAGAGPPLVFLHGFTGSTETWADLWPALAVAHRVVAFDLPGHGRSSVPADPRRYSLARFADDLANALDQLGLARVALLGYSMGGRAALQFARQYADRVAALVLLSTSSGIREEAKRRERLASDAVLADSIEREGVRAFVDRWEMLPLWESQRVLSAETRARLRALRLLNDPVGLANSLRGAGAGIDAASAIFRRILAPTLILAGALDPAYVEHGRSLEAELPNAHMEVISDAGHAIHLEQSAALVGVTTAFLKAIPCSADGW